MTKELPHPRSVAGPSQVVPGGTIGRYRVTSYIGQGGMGVVYLADDPVLTRKVALKLLPPELASDEEQRKKAIKEAERASHFSDPHVAQVLDVVQEDGQVILVMEYVEGEMLRERIVSGISLEDFWDLAIQCVEAVESAHREGFLHRDIKPENIMITPKGQVKILDFGIAKRLPRPEELATMTTQTYNPYGVAGTPPYMSPEAHLNEALDARSDLFSMGVVFYEMLVGSRPFQGNLAEVIDGILHGSREPPSVVDPRIPPALDHVVLKLLARKPGERHGSASELLDDLLAARRGELLIPTEPLEPAVDQEQEPGPSFPFSWKRVLLFVFALLFVVSMAVPGFRTPLKRILGVSLLPDRVSLAILPFEVEEEDAALASFSLGLTKVVADRMNRLGASSGYYVAPMSAVTRYEVVSPEQARTQLGVTLALKSRIAISGTELIGELELVDAKTLEVLERTDFQEVWTNPVQLVTDLGNEVARFIEIDATPAAAVQLPAGDYIAASTYRFHLQGLGKLEAAKDSASVAGAISEFERAISVAPEFAPAWAQMGLAQFRMFEQTHAESWLLAAGSSTERALLLEPDIPDAHYVLALISSEEEAWEASAREYQAAIDQDPMYQEAYAGLANAHERLGQLDNAEAAFESVIAALPLDFYGYWYLGYFHHRHGHDAKAREAFHRATQACPDWSPGYAYYGGYLVRAGRYREAVRALERSIELQPIDSAFTNLGNAYFQLRDFDKAIRTYQEAIGLGYINHRMWYNLGDAYFWAPGKRHLAAEPYGRAVDLGRERMVEYPDDVFVVGEMADLFPKVKQPDSAQVYVRRCLAMQPDNPDVNYWAALVAWQLDRRVEALDFLEKALAEGYSRVWIRDSVIFDEWRDLPRFLSIMEGGEESSDE